MLDYTPSEITTARYSSAWQLDIVTELGNPIALRVTPVTDVKQQSMWMGALVEYTEASATVSATGTIDGVDGARPATRR